jgi:hypothetical protein
VVLHLVSDPVPDGVVHRRIEVPGFAEGTRASVSRLVVNPADLERWSPRSRVAAAKAPAPVPGPVRYLVVTTAELMPSFQRLVDHRAAGGLPGAVVSLEEILASYRQGLDRAETIRLFLQHAYAWWGVDYVLLGGDTEILPTRTIPSTYYPAGGESRIPADLYFAGLDGDWNADGDDRFGEPYLNGTDVGDFADLVPEIALGRAPVRNPAEAEVFVDKILAYEDPVETAPYRQVLFASEVLFPQGWDPGEEILRDGATFSEPLAALVADVGHMGFLRLYENHTAYPGSLPETRASVLAAMESGDYGLVHHVGHGFYFNMHVGDADITVSDADALGNPQPFLLLALNCDSAAFDFNCLLERFLRNPEGGSVASVGSSRAAFDVTTNEYQQALYRVLFQGRRQRLGDAVLESRLGFAADTFYNTVDRWTQLVYTVLGDPALRVWTTEPRQTGVDAPQRISVGQDTAHFLVWDSATGDARDSVTVALWKDGEPLTVGWTGPAGRLHLPVSTATEGIWQWRVSGRNVQPVQGALEAVAPAAAALTLRGLVVDDTAGNGNQTAEAGETVRLRPVVINGGSLATSGGTLILRTAPSSLVVSDSTATFPPLAGGGSAAALEGFEIHLALDVVEGRPIPLTVAVQPADGEEVEEETALIPAAPALEVVSLALEDAGGDGEADPGEDVDLVFTLENLGGGAAGVVAGALGSEDPAVEILDGSGTWIGLDTVRARADNGADPFRIRQGAAVEPPVYRLEVSDARGGAITVDFDLERPPRPLGLRSGLAGAGEILLVWEPTTAADLSGYRVYRRQEGDTEFQPAHPHVLRAGAIYLDEGLPGRTRFEYRVAAVDEGGLEGPLSDPVSVSTAPPEVACFPLPIGQETSGALAVGHMDLDGIPDVAVGSDHIYVLDGACLEKVDGDGDSQSFGPLSAQDGGFQPSGVAMGELDGRPGQEVVAANWTTRSLYAYDAQGTLLPGWPLALFGRTWGTPVLGDLDGDGDLEVVINDLSGWTYAFHHDGGEVADGDGDPGTVGPIAPRRSGEIFGRVTPALLDVDGDGSLEILFGTKYLDGSVEVFHALKPDGSGDAAGFPIPIGVDMPFLASPVVGDVDGDGEVEIVAQCENDSLYVWEKDGSRSAPFPIRLVSNSINFSSQTPSPALADFDEDGIPEIVAVGVTQAGRSFVHVLDRFGQERSGWPVECPGLSESSPVVGDLDGDGQLDVVYGIGGGADTLPNLLYVFDTDGTAFDGFPLTLDGFVRATPTLADLDGNGSVDLLLASWDRLIHVWDMQAPYDPERTPWPTFHGNVHRDGRLGAPSPTPVAAPARGPLLAAPYPNPFNPATVLAFEVPVGGGRVRVSVHDVTGRTVRVLLDAFRPAGADRIGWDGTDARGRPVASGVYFARLEVAGHAAASRKLALIR